MQSKVNPGADCLSNQMTKPPNYIWDRDLESHPMPERQTRVAPPSVPDTGSGSRALGCGHLKILHTF